MKWFLGLTHSISTYVETSFRNLDSNLLFASTQLVVLIFFFALCLYLMRGIFNEEKIKSQITKSKNNEPDLVPSMTNQWSPTTFVNESLPPDLAVQIQKRIKTINQSKSS